MPKELELEILEVDLSQMKASWRLKVDMVKAMKAVTSRATNKVKKNLKTRTNWDGSSFPAGWTLNKTGTLLASIKWQKRLLAIAPSTWPRPDIPARLNSNYGLMMELYQRARRAGKMLDPFGYHAQDARAKYVADAMVAELNRQIAKGELGLVNELSAVRAGKAGYRP